jgi:exopolysaccharide biosynthesis polyprenyl glycosylphosphotransferase
VNVLAPSAEIAERPPGVGRLESKAMLRFRLAIALVAADCLTVLAAFSAAGLLRSGQIWNGNSPILLGAFLPIYLICACMTKAYSGTVLLKRSTALASGMSALLVAAAVTAMVIFFLKVGSQISRIHFAGGLALAGVLLPLSRGLATKYTARRLGGSLYSRVELRDGTRSIVDDGAPSIDTRPFFDPADPTPASLDRLAQSIAKADRVVVNCPDERRAAWAHALQGMNVHGEVVLPSFADIRPLGIGSFAGRTTVVVGRGPLKPGERFAKRLFDLTLSLGAMIVLWPLLLLVALAIKLDSPGPVIFRQPRIGRQNRQFDMFKFRSMHVSDCDGAGVRSASRGDDRITRVGRFIRRTSIDELPQIFNVLLGTMSIVGPRPHAIGSTAEDKLFWEIDGRYWHRHACKPGLTGLAQVRGLRGSTTCLQDITDRLAADLEYLARWSLWRDVVIVLQTARVIWHRNAY